ncbi:tetratricopeptide repeat protein [Cohaesibacter sp. CAU 1516]|uniref:heme biosynthesis protein HemY n=1 Tax=Cohaesibacter sp. CAU 1516 TaxID=2576038 RepID=UPI0010FD536A|nr:heme biosynthesis HemY N-terminal domain-containing protein [Cohaesibacter sp. CAU 1516]TLP47041.1 tetratricopeptide repeat protein [Cohaesibacter sp. CAU 1516]
MIKALIFFAILLGIAFGGAWLADRPGQIIVEWPWLDTEIGVSLLTGFLMLVALVIVAIIVWMVFIGMIRIPQSISGFFTGRRRDKGYKALSTGMVAVGVGDLALARKQALKARKLIGSDPMTLMLEAQTAQLAGDATKARQSFEAMLEQDETRPLGRRGLYIEAQRRGDAEEAFTMAKAATGDGKKTPGWAGTALFDIQTAAADWKGALLTLSQNQANKHVTKEQFRRRRAVILTAQAMELEEQPNSADAMRGLLLEACKLAPGLVPAAAKAAGVLNELKDYRKASKVIETAWRVEPHPDLAEAYATIKTGDTALERLKRVRSLYALMPDHTESKIAMARACINAREWAEARSLLAPLVDSHLTPRLCMMMAELEEGDKNDFGLLRQWLARAVGAHPDPVWTADGQVSDRWQPTSPVTGKLDAFEWKVPVNELADMNRPVLESADLASQEGPNEDDLVLIPNSEDTSKDLETPAEAAVEAPVADAKEEADIPVAEPVEDDVPVAEPVDDDAAATAIDVDSEVDTGEEVADAAKAETPSEEGVAASKPKDVEFPMKQAPDDPGPKFDPTSQRPDDPGPKPGAKPGERKKRFRLF